MYTIDDVEDLKYQELEFPNDISVSSEVKEFLRNSLNVNALQRPSVLSLTNIPLI
jgi:hypothetical protein